jgi:hypothetical protein
MKRWLCLVCTVITTAGLASAQDRKISLSSVTQGMANLELTVYLVSGLAQVQAPGKDEVPADLAETLQQLRGVFAYKSYRLIEAVTLRGRNYSGAAVGGQLPDFSTYSFRYAKARISPEVPHVVHLDGLWLEITRRHSDRTDSIALVSTDLDVRDGQKTVVGKSAVNATDAVFLVIVPKVVE